MDGILNSFVKRKEKGSDKEPYHLPAPPSPSDFQQQKETLDKDHNAMDIIFLHYIRMVSIVDMSLGRAVTSLSLPLIVMMTFDLASFGASE
jgi:hypothetical protein